MSTLEQVKLLETKVAKAIDYVNRVNDENTMLREKLNGYQTRIDELEVLIKQFREDQGQIEGGILSALDRLNQFEDAIERGISRIHPKDELLHKEEKTALSVPLVEKDGAAIGQGETFTVSPEADGDSRTTLFSETSPAEDSGEAPEDEASSDAAIMAALEAEEKALKARNQASPEEHPSDQLEIF